MLKKAIGDSLFGAILGAFIFYMIIGPYNTMFVEFMQVVEKKGNALLMSLLFVPALFVFFFIFIYAIKYPFAEKTSKKNKKTK